MGDATLRIVCGCESVIAVSVQHRLTVYPEVGQLVTIATRIKGLHVAVNPVPVQHRLAVYPDVGLLGEIGASIKGLREAVIAVPVEHWLLADPEVGPLIEVAAPIDFLLVAVKSMPVQQWLLIDPKVSPLSDIAVCINGLSDAVIAISMKRRLIVNCQIASLNPVTKFTVCNVNRYDAAATGLQLAVKAQIENTSRHEVIALINETLTKNPFGFGSALSIEIEVYLADDSAQLIIVKLVTGDFGAPTLRTLNTISSPPKVVGCASGASRCSCRNSRNW